MLFNSDNLVNPEFARLLFVHAHPDDESIFTGGTIAKYAQLGAKIMILSCTLGEEGEVIFPEIEGLLAHNGADQLGGYRYVEMQNALAAFNKYAIYPVQHAWLGGVGTWRDSGMDWMPLDSQSNAAASENSPPVHLHKSAFIQGAYNTEQFQLQISQLSAVIHDFQPTHIISYDEQGIYGHPDHIHVHNLCRAVMHNLLVAIPQLWEVTLESYIIAEALHKVQSQLLPRNWIMPKVMSVCEKETANMDQADYIRIPIGDYVQVQRAALQAHRSQLIVHERENVLILTNRIVQPFGYIESYHQIESED